MNLVRLAVAAACWLCCTTAFAQGWLADRSGSQGRGIQLGQLALHPGIGSEIGYSSNVFLADDDPQSAAVLRVSPYIYVETTGGEETPLDLRAGVAGSFKHFFATEQDTDIAVTQDAKLRWRASRIFELDLHQAFSRVIDPFTDATLDGDPTGIPVDSDRHTISGGTRFQLQSPGGLLRSGIGFDVAFENFEGDEFDANDNLTYTGTLDAGYEFLPRTAVFWNGTYSINEYVDAQPPLTASGETEISDRNDSSTVGTTVGINGALTSTVGFTTAVGYTAGFFDGGSDYEAINGQAQLRWIPRDGLNFTLGYQRTARTAFQGNYVINDRIAANAQMMFGGVFLLRPRVEVTFQDFGEDARLQNVSDMLGIGTGGDRNDILLLAGISGEYRFTDWFAVTGEFTYLEDFTDFEYVIAGGTDAMGNPIAATTDEAAYQRFEVWLGVRVFL